MPDGILLRAAAFALSLFAAVATTGGDASAESAPRLFRIVAFGDSLVAG